MGPPCDSVGHLEAPKTGRIIRLRPSLQNCCDPHRVPTTFYFLRGFQEKIHARAKEYATPMMKHDFKPNERRKHQPPTAVIYSGACETLAANQKVLCGERGHVRPAIRPSAPMSTRRDQGRKQMR